MEQKKLWELMIEEQKESGKLTIYKNVENDNEIAIFSFKNNRKKEITIFAPKIFHKLEDIATKIKETNNLSCGVAIEKERAWFCLKCKTKEWPKCLTIINTVIPLSNLLEEEVSVLVDEILSKKWVPQILPDELNFKKSPNYNPNSISSYLNILTILLTWRGTATQLQQENTDVKKVNDYIARENINVKKANINFKTENDALKAINTVNENTIYGFKAIAEGANSSFFPYEIEDNIKKENAALKKENDALKNQLSSLQQKMAVLKQKMEETPSTTNSVASYTNIFSQNQSENIKDTEIERSKNAILTPLHY